MNKIFLLSALSLAIAGCSSDDPVAPEVSNTFGTVEISGEAEAGQTLTATVTDADGVDGGAISYQWSANGTEISGATSSTYVIDESLASATITVTVSYTDNASNDELITSDETSAVSLPPVNVVGTVTISGVLESGSVLTATVADDNGFDAATVTYEWAADTVAISGATAATYTLTDDEVGKTITVKAMYSDNDEFSEDITSAASAAVAAAGNNSPATFAGDLTASVSNDATADVTGTITVTDADSGEDMVQVQTAATTTYGTFSVAADGSWTYTLDTNNSTVSSLSDANDTVTDTTAVSSTDGSSTDLVITISGVTPQSTVSQVAQIMDTMDNDAGELRYKLSSSDIIETGSLTVSFMKDPNVVNQNGDAKDAYIALYGTSTSTSAALVDLRIGTDSFVIRDQDDIDVTIPFTPGVWTDVEMTWDASAASSTVAPTVTISIDGVAVTTTAFSSASSDLGAVADGVQTVVFKLADTSSVITGAAYYIDDVKLYADTSGTIQFEDDFESYSVGDSLDDDNSASPYNSATADATVVSVDKAPPAAAVDNQMAQITDNMDNDAGELRYKLSSSDIIEAGKLTVSFLKEDNAVNQNGDAKDAYIAIYGTSTSTSAAIVDLRIGVDAFQIRDQDDIDVTIPFTPGQWMDVEITWDATSASSTVAPLVTIAIDGTQVTTTAFSSASSDLGSVADGVQTVIFKLADTSSIIADAAYFIDEFKLYADMNDTIQFEDDFESYNEGDSLDDDNPNSPYNSSTAEAIVVKE